MQRLLNRAAWDIEKTNVDIEYGQLNSVKKDNSITLSQSFAFPTVYSNQHKLAKASTKSSEMSYTVTKAERISVVKSTYFQLAYYYSKLRQLRYQDSLFTSFSIAAARREQAGETNLLEKVSAESQSQEVRNFIRQTKADISITERSLQYLMNCSQPVGIVDTVLVKLDISANDLNGQIGANPSLSFEKQKTEIAALETNLEKSKLLPDIKIGYFNQSMVGEQDVNGVPKIFSTSDRLTGIQAGITIPLWSMPQTARIKAAVVNQKIAQTNAESYAQLLNNQYETMLAEYEKDKSSLDYYEKSALPQADLIISQSSKSYKAGSLNYNEYIQSLTNALQIKENYLEVLHHYNQAIIAIETILGKN